MFVIRSWPLQDWVKLLKDAKTDLNLLDFYKDSTANKTNEEGVLMTTKPNLPPCLKMIKDLFSLSKHKGALNVLRNIQIAALHLACMLGGTAGMEN